MQSGQHSAKKRIACSGRINRVGRICRDAGIQAFWQFIRRNCATGFTISDDDGLGVVFFAEDLRGFQRVAFAGDFDDGGFGRFQVIGQVQRAFELLGVA